VLWMKRLEKVRFQWPLVVDRWIVVALNAQQVNWLLDGYELTRMQGHAVLARLTPCYDVRTR
jgi:transposase